MNFNELYVVSNNTYVLILLHIFLFAIGFTAINKKMNFVYDSESLKKEILPMKLFLPIQIFVLILLLYYAKKYNEIVKETLAFDVRLIRYQIGPLFETIYDFLIYSYLIISFVYISVVYSITNFVLVRKINISLIVSISSVLALDFIGLGRHGVFLIFIFFILSLGLSKSKLIYTKKKVQLISNNLKFYTIIFSSIIFGLLAVASATSLRRGQEITNFEDFVYWFSFTFEQGITYFTGPFIALDYFLDNRIYENIGYTFGRASISGIEDILYYLSQIFGFNFVTTNEKIASFTMEPIAIGYDQNFNAFYTSIMNFYLDGGVIFLIIMSLIFGVTTAALWNYYKKHPNILTFSLIVFFTKTTITSQYKLDFIIPSNLIIFFSLLYLARRYNSPHEIKHIFKKFY